MVPEDVTRRRPSILHLALLHGIRHAAFWQALGQRTVSDTKRTVGNATLWVCAALDWLPAYEQGRWYAHGGWGCRWHVNRLWAAWGSEDRVES